LATIEFKLRPVNDNPTDDAKLLGHDVIVRTLKDFVESNEMISSSSVAIHGDWGTGKTSIMSTLHNKLDKSKIEVLFFEAWKYEYTNPSLGLIAEITETYLRGNAELAKRIVEAAVYILTDKFLGVDIQHLERIIRGNRQRMTSLTEELKKIVASIHKRFIIIIDDLDRCDVENALQILALMKLFLSIDNCVVIAAVDFKRLQQAWTKKYQVTDNDKDSRDYLDKIFQIRIAIPVPPLERIREYILSLTENMPRELQDIVSVLFPKNPRAIKRILNLISYRSYLLSSPHKIYSSCLWTTLEQFLGNDVMIRMCQRIAMQSNLVDFIFVGNWEHSQNTLNKVCARELLDKIDMEGLKMFIEQSNRLVKAQKIIRSDLEKDFDTLFLNTNEYS